MICNLQRKDSNDQPYHAHLVQKPFCCVLVCLPAANRTTRTKQATGCFDLNLRLCVLISSSAASWLGHSKDDVACVIATARHARVHYRPPYIQHDGTTTSTCTLLNTETDTWYLLHYIFQLAQRRGDTMSNTFTKCLCLFRSLLVSWISFQPAIENGRPHHW